MSGSDYLRVPNLQVHRRDSSSNMEAMKIWIGFTLAIVATSLAGCDGSSPPAPPASVDHDYGFEMPDFMEEEPRGRNSGKFEWLWYSKDGLTTFSHVLKRESIEALESSKTLKAVIYDQVGVFLDSDFAEVAPGKFYFEERKEKGWTVVFAEKTPDQRCTIALFAIYSSVTPTVNDPEKAEALVEALKSGRFEPTEASEE